MNNREIKFRVWSHPLQKMFYDNISTFEPGQFNVWMEYTNITDIKHKKIYEGDIVKVPVYDGWFDESECKFCNYTVMWSYFEDGWRGYAALMNDNIHAGVKLINPEIVGNIFENPDLMHFNAKEFVNDIHKKIGWNENQKN